MAHLTYQSIARSLNEDEIVTMLRALDTLALAIGKQPGHIDYLNKTEMAALAERAKPIALSEWP